MQQRGFNGQSSFKLSVQRYKIMVCNSKVQYVIIVVRYTGWTFENLTQILQELYYFKSKRAQG